MGCLRKMHHYFKTASVPGFTGAFCDFSAFAFYHHSAPYAILAVVFTDAFCLCLLSIFFRKYALFCSHWNGNKTITLHIELGQMGRKTERVMGF